jgi:hypothetical protein
MSDINFSLGVSEGVQANLTITDNMSVNFVLGEFNTNSVVAGNVGEIQYKGSTNDFAASPNLTYANGVVTAGNLTVSGKSTLGNIGNISITGGTVGQFIKTDGAGNLSFTSATTAAGGSNSQVQFNSNGAFEGSNALTFSSSSNTLTATNFAGNGAGLSGLAAANISGSANLTGLIVTGTSVLGDITNVRVTGGTNGQVLRTDGTGNLSWGTGSTGNIGATNLDGNANTYLAGDGTWKTYATGNIISTNLNGNAQEILTGAGTYIAAANTGATGNIAVLNLSGNANTYLDGSGNWTTLVIPNIGNIANLSLSGNANTYLDGSGNWTAITLDPTRIVNGNSNVSITSNGGNVTVGINGTANIVQIHEGGVAVDGYLETTSRVYPESLEVVNIANLIIPGGNSGEVLSTNGTGVLSWKAVANGNIGAVSLTGNSGQVLLGNGTWSTYRSGNIGDINLTVASNTATSSVLSANGAWTALGNLSSSNLSGNAAQYLAGDGTWKASPTGNIVSTNLDGNASNVLLGNGVFSSFDGILANNTGNITANVVTANAVQLQDTTEPNSTITITANSNGTTYTLTLPITGGTAGQALFTGGNGQLYWGTAGASGNTETIVDTFFTGTTATSLTNTDEIVTWTFDNTYSPSAAQFGSFSNSTPNYVTYNIGSGYGSNTVYLGAVYNNTTIVIRKTTDGANWEGVSAATRNYTMSGDGTSAMVRNGNNLAFFTIENLNGGSPQPKVTNINLSTGNITYGSIGSAVSSVQFYSMGSVGSSGYLLSRYFASGAGQYTSTITKLNNTGDLSLGTTVFSLTGSQAHFIRPDYVYFAAGADGYKYFICMAYDPDAIPAGYSIRSSNTENNFVVRTTPGISSYTRMCASPTAMLLSASYTTDPGVRYLFRSTNGVDWSGVRPFDVNHIVWDGTRFIIDGTDGVNLGLFTSPDGLTWTYASSRRMSPDTQGSDCIAATETIEVLGSTEVTGASYAPKIQQTSYSIVLPAHASYSQQTLTYTPTLGASTDIQAQTLGNLVIAARPTYTASYPSTGVVTVDTNSGGAIADVSQIQNGMAPTGNLSLSITQGTSVAASTRDTVIFVDQGSGSTYTYSPAYSESLSTLVNNVVAGETLSNWSAGVQSATASNATARWTKTSSGYSAPDKRIAVTVSPGTSSTLAVATYTINTGS